jgi:hypothetical protein
MVRIDVLQEHDVFRLRGGKKDYTFIRYESLGDRKGRIYYTNADGVIFQRRMFNFTLVHKMM